MYYVLCICIFNIYVQHWVHLAVHYDDEGIRSKIERGTYLLRIERDVYVRYWHVTGVSILHTHCQRLRINNERKQIIFLIEWTIPIPNPSFPSHTLQRGAHIGNMYPYTYPMHIIHIMYERNSSKSEFEIVGVVLMGAYRCTRTGKRNRMNRNAY